MSACIFFIFLKEFVISTCKQLTSVKVIVNWFFSTE